MNRQLLYLSLSLGLFLHGLFFLLIQNHEFHPRLLPAHTIALFSDQAFETLQKKARTALLARSFENLMEVPREIKEDLHELVAEFAPSPLLSFPRGEPILKSAGPVTIKTEAIALKGSDEGLYDFLDGCPIVTSAPDPIDSEIPLLESIDDADDYMGKGMIAGSEHFDIHVEYTPRQDRPGYVFKVTFYPKVDVVFKRISQNYYFLIDRSNSIPRGRFLVNKRLVSEALDYLKPHDTFNILLFDDKVTKFSETNQYWNEESVARAREFLKSQSHGGYFAATELYSSLGKVIPNQVSDHEVHTAILLSDGDSYLPMDRQRQTIGGWTKQNNGKVSLFSIAMGGGNNLPLLDLISSFNRGALIYSMNHIEVNDRAIDLIRTIRNPIGKRITATAVPTDKQMVVLLQPKRDRLPCLYKDRPFTIYGSTNRLSDFVIFLQGNFYDSHFDIKKHITFSEAKLGTASIERAWTQLLVQEFYERYFEDGNPKHIEEAKKLLAPLNLSVPFDQVAMP